MSFLALCLSRGRGITGARLAAPSDVLTLRERLCRLVLPIAAMTLHASALLRVLLDLPLYAGRVPSLVDAVAWPRNLWSAPSAGHPQHPIDSDNVGRSTRGSFARSATRLATARETRFDTLAIMAATAHANAVMMRGVVSASRVISVADLVLDAAAIPSAGASPA